MEDKLFQTESCTISHNYNEIEKVLTIEGCGQMKDFGEHGQDWEEEMKEETTIIIGNEITSIGNYAFYTIHNVITVIIGNKVESIGECAFSLVLCQINLHT